MRALPYAVVHHELVAKVAALSNQKVNLFSDLLLHDMGTGLADGVSQGEAGPREFRTAPLWGLGQRIFFLHDGRSSDLIATQGAREHGLGGERGRRQLPGAERGPEAEPAELPALALDYTDGRVPRTGRGALPNDEFLAGSARGE